MISSRDVATLFDRAIESQRRQYALAESAVDRCRREERRVESTIGEESVHSVADGTPHTHAEQLRYFTGLAQEAAVFDAAVRKIAATLEAVESKQGSSTQYPSDVLRACSKAVPTLAAALPILFSVMSARVYAILVSLLFRAAVAATNQEWGHSEGGTGSVDYALWGIGDELPCLREALPGGAWGVLLDKVLEHSNVKAVLFDDAPLSSPSESGTGSPTHHGSSGMCQSDGPRAVCRIPPSLVRYGTLHDADLRSRIMLKLVSCVGHEASLPTLPAEGGLRADDRQDGESLPSPFDGSLQHFLLSTLQSGCSTGNEGATSVVERVVTILRAEYFEQLLRSLATFLARNPPDTAIFYVFDCVYLSLKKQAETVVKLVDPQRGGEALSNALYTGLYRILQLIQGTEADGRAGAPSLQHRTRADILASVKQLAEDHNARLVCEGMKSAHGHEVLTLVCGNTDSLQQRRERKVFFYISHGAVFRRTTREAEFTPCPDVNELFA